MTCFRSLVSFILVTQDVNTWLRSAGPTKRPCNLQLIIWRIPYQDHFQGSLPQTLPLNFHLQDSAFVQEVKALASRIECLWVWCPFFNSWSQIPTKADSEFLPPPWETRLEFPMQVPDFSSIWGVNQWMGAPAFSLCTPCPIILNIFF